MAALQRRDAPAVDSEAVKQFFPEWVAGEGKWDRERVIADLVLAVSQLATKASVDSSTSPPTNTFSRAF
jgi:hypothetical protein